MEVRRPFPTRGVLRRPPIRPIDVLVGGAIIGLLYGVVRLAGSMNAAFPPHSVSKVSSDPTNLPYYAARSLLRMFIALGISTVFTFVYATAAARSRRAEKVLIPILDILQSVPILGFLTFTVTFFVNAFNGSLFGLECAAIFAIFTSQAWNMTFSFYHSLVTQPPDLDEAARMLRLTKWQRFWRLDVPGSMIGLVWNGMMSFGGGWFFLAASEAITVLNKQYALPGIGSYVATAATEGSLSHTFIAILVMIIVVLGVNFVFWRPLVAWAEKFRVEESEAAEKPRSIMLDILRRSSVPGFLGRVLRPVGRLLDRITRPFGRAEYPLRADERRRRRGDLVFWAVVIAVVAWGAYAGLAYVNRTVGFSQFPHAFGLGAITLLRVVILVIGATLVWVPIGVWIGMNPRLSRFAQPIVQILASFPANFLFPFAAAVFVAFGISLNIGGIFLMALGAQWYILFNVIAGASAIPTDLREAMTNFGVRRWLSWKRLILPAIFGAYVTGGITAAGGAWNAAIVAEVVTFGSHHLTATGLGAYITHASQNGDLAKVLVGVIVMSFYVVIINRLLWRRLYRLSETKYSL
ncbi:MAG TPA: ABC transporter permease subunit [Acidimicrobiales bacterium]|nr:ABC transporter permease subunit [Acidimicrobiales bacterium]